MQYVFGQLIPTLSSHAGSSLTFANWQEAGVQTISYNLEELLIKPGLTILKKLAHLTNYITWPGEIVLDATMLTSTKEGIYHIRSVYDGQLIEITVPAVALLINQLKPNKVLLPPGSLKYFDDFWHSISAEIELYLHQDELTDDQKVAGYYIIYTAQPFDNFYINLQRLKHSVYLIGDFDFGAMQTLFKNNYNIQADRPASDAMAGIFYANQEKLNILSQEFQRDYQALAKNCQCQTCLKQLTRAYLHHLLQQTPLLAQRYLIQHNIHYCQNYFINQN
ncbi:queuine tRNA-ribosyltransferase [Legionella sp. D16C41]|uniref:queuine tRNA-ribosyltransferase n=1 Tax=Legionella sp. D16C41 TaxID=3402688 RepID=UPI003AF5EDAD